MSLTTPVRNTERLIKSLIKTYIPSKEQFYTTDKSKCFDTKKKCIIGYELESQYDASLCGAAFDYLARFFIARKVTKNKGMALKGLISEHIITSSNFHTISIDVKVKQRYEKKGVRVSIPEGIIYGDVYSFKYWEKICDIPTEDIGKLVDKEKIKINKLLKDEESFVKKYLHEEYAKILKPIEDYIFGGGIDEELLINACLVLSKMELAWRSGVAIELSEIFCCSVEMSNAKKELRGMLDSFKKIFLSLVNEESVVVYNPTFGIGSYIIGGADADVFIDGVLYDFKTSKKNGWSSADATQMMGYFLLDSVAKKCNDKRNKLSKNVIDKIALYRVRYEEIAFFDIKEIPTELLEDTIKNICYTYLMFSMSRLCIGKDGIKKIIRKYKCQMAENDFRYCSDMYADELKYYLKHGDELNLFFKKRKR